MNCRVFQNRDAAMNDIAGRLSRGKSACEKARLARQLGQEAESLLACPDQRSDSQDCKNCRAIAARRKRIMARMTESLRTIDS